MLLWRKRSEVILGKTGEECNLFLTLKDRGIEVRRIGRIGNANDAPDPKQIEDIDRVAIGPIGNEDLIGGDAEVRKFVGGDRLAQKRIAVAGPVAPHPLFRGDLLDAVRDCTRDRGGQGKRDIANAEVEDFDVGTVFLSRPAFAR